MNEYNTIFYETIDGKIPAKGISNKPGLRHACKNDPYIGNAPEKWT